MRFYIVGPFQYRTAAGTLRYYNPATDSPYATFILDTTDPAWDTPDPFVAVPVLGLRPMDTDAQTALNTARLGLTGRQLPGVGVLPVSEPIYNP